MEPAPGGSTPSAGGADDAMQNLEDLDGIEDDIDLDDLEYQQLLREQIDFANEEAAAEAASLQAAHAAAVANTAAIAAAVNQAGQQNNNAPQRSTIVHLGRYAKYYRLTDLMFAILVGRFSFGTPVFSRCGRDFFVPLIFSNWKCYPVAALHGLLSSISPSLRS